MANKFDHYLELLAEEVLDKEQHVSFKWVCDKMDVPANSAKQMLYDFVQRNTSKVKAVYLVSGILQSNQQHAVQLVPSSDHDKTVNRLFSSVFSIHVYSVLPASLPITTASDLYVSVGHSDFNFQAHGIITTPGIGIRASADSNAVYTSKSVAVKQENLKGDSRDAPRETKTIIGEASKLKKSTNKILEKKQPAQDVRQNTPEKKHVPDTKQHEPEKQKKMKKKDLKDEMLVEEEVTQTPEKKKEKKKEKKQTKEQTSKQNDSKRKSIDSKGNHDDDEPMIDFDEEEDKSEEETDDEEDEEEMGSDKPIRKNVEQSTTMKKPEIKKKQKKKHVEPSNAGAMDKFTISPSKEQKQTASAQVTKTRKQKVVREVKDAKGYNVLQEFWEEVPIENYSMEDEKSSNIVKNVKSKESPKKERGKTKESSQPSAQSSIMSFFQAKKK